MRHLAGWRHRRPGWWLALGLFTDMLTYATGARPTLFWVALDLWLAYRAWRGGATALAWFRGLELFETALATVVLVLVHTTADIESGATSGTLLLCAISSWAVMAPALSNHVGPRGPGGGVVGPRAPVRSSTP